MKKVSFCMIVVAAIALVIALANTGPLVTTVDAFDTWSTARTSGNCADCHGNYQATNYVPQAAARQGVVWPTGLHNSHRNASPNNFLNGNCNACHSGTARFPVPLNVSAAAAPFNQGCNGCHSGPGTRNHHERLVGVGTCSSCHGAEPIGNEKTPLPAVYTAAIGTTSGTTRINNPCNDGAAGRVFEGGFFDVSTVGLDNDGDGLYDQADPDCQAAPPPPAPCANFTSAACTVPGAQGACAASRTVCNATTGAVTCPQTVQPIAETCNSVDDNCDGTVDNITIANCTIPGLSGPCAAGRTACVAGANVCQQAVQPVAETCNNVDDNCDGTVDNITAAACTTGRPGICAAGTTACAAGAPVCNQTTPQGTEGPFPTRCADNLDNDCDGLTDAADPQCAVAAEANCFDGIDNNQDGRIDCADPTCANATGPATTCGVGACAATGNRVCRNGVEANTCIAGAPTAEVCDGRDNDCNGTVDNGIAATAITCGTGACQRTGQRVCQAGALVNQCTPGTPTAETCNNIDDDCNGVIDNIAAVVTNCGVGACATTGQQVCQNGATVNTCTPLAAGVEGPFGTASCGDGRDNDCDGTTDAADQGCVQQCVPTTEICDGVDNDCDGQIDEGIAPVTINCGVGACATSGQRVCVNGRLADQCTPLPAGVEGPFGTATCADGIDNDCDGIVDAADQNCVLVCVPTPEICDGKDNDCNGVIDDNIAATPTTCGVGACANNGQRVCQNGQLVDTCQPRPAGAEQFGVGTACSDNIDNDCDTLVDAADPGCFTPAPAVEQACFDGVDNDLDGRVDCADPDCATAVDAACNTGLAGPCAAGQTKCVNGAAACVQNVLPIAEICTDGIDNNCDGLTDNCQVQPPPVVLTDVDFEGFNVAGRVNICPAPRTPVFRPSVTVENEGSTQACVNVTVVGVQNGVEVYRQVRNVCLNHDQETRVSFPEPSVRGIKAGTITWTASIADDNTDRDLRTAATRVLCYSSSSSRD